MRLICPNCGAQYEVPTEVIPEDGRDVQCSSCQHTWFQTHPDHPPATETEAPPAPEPPAADTAAEDAAETDAEPEAPAPRRDLDPEIAEVFREEREFEKRRRAAEAGGLESQPDLGLEAAPPGPHRRRRAKPAETAPAESAPPVAEEAGQGAVEESRKSASRRALLPDVDEINQTLRSDEPRAIDTTERISADDYETETGGSGFARGFVLVILLAAICLAVYASAPRIAESVPGLAEPLEQYVTMVDRGRIWLDAQVGDLFRMLEGTRSEGGTPDA